LLIFDFRLVVDWRSEIVDLRLIRRGVSTGFSKLSITRQHSSINN